MVDFKGKTYGSYLDNAINDWFMEAINLPIHDLSMLNTMHIEK